jgi:hypothetical protein
MPTTTATSTAARTAIPTATTTRAPTSAATSTTTPALTAPATPTPIATPDGDKCGNGTLDHGETCDADQDAACPTLCTATCKCPKFYALPLQGWTRAHGDGTWGVDVGSALQRTADSSSRDAADDLPILYTVAAETPATAFGIAYPARSDLGVPYSVLALTIGGDEEFAVEVDVRAATGPKRTLAYTAADGVPTVRRHDARFPLGHEVASGELGIVYRDLAADLRAAFGVAFAEVEQVRLLGSVRAAHILLASPEVGRGAAVTAALTGPLDGWVKRGSGASVVHGYDATIDAATVRAARPVMLDYPSPREVLLARYRTLSFAVRDHARFSAEVRIRTAEGRTRVLRYDERTTEPRRGLRRAVLPLVTTPIGGSDFSLATLDLATDVAALDPGATIDGVLSIRLRGRFEIADVILQDRVD